MRTITLLVASILLTTGFANAQERRNLSASVSTTRFSFDEPISFTERGIEFFVFQNGDFDFNTRPNDSQGDYFFRSAGKKGANTTVARGPAAFKNGLFFSFQGMAADMIRIGNQGRQEWRVFQERRVVVKYIGIQVGSRNAKYILAPVVQISSKGFEYPLFYFLCAEFRPIHKYLIRRISR